MEVSDTVSKVIDERQGGWKEENGRRGKEDARRREKERKVGRTGTTEGLKKRQRWQLPGGEEEDLGKVGSWKNCNVAGHRNRMSPEKRRFNVIDF